MKTYKIEAAAKIPLNTSGVKNAFSFSKNKRFEPTR